ncbi:acetyl/propionyl/methylcrotonyl-CoA carboxylase subunit alpha [Corynebacterium oculi]|uniref:biotin carboxylase n=1 Tax=Corynebacterium oculi TaxID=1544416 RepID=A0A0N8VZD4_9CORY|nr:biotin carboxylase N-terminal domain-containing protein [Corynebacterium oculi]KQB83586.1 2-oxoglutarate carboxylase small subunit [Corynebacterium oculi]
MSEITPLSTVLIANRGEIAVRIARVAADLGMRSIAVYSDADAEAPHALAADEAYRLPGTSPAETYLNAPAIIDIAVRAGANCIHPGYGFLSENSSFARDVIAAGMTWIGPRPETIDSLGDKVSARRIAESVGAPLAPGTSDPVDSWEQARDFAEEHGLPIAIKAAFGGGGRGLKVVSEASEIEDAFLSAGREATEAFGRGECFVEKFLTKPRHVEAQVLADSHGNVAVLGTRDCSTQRRFQKLVEEAPAPFLTDKQRTAIIEGAREVCRAAGYLGAGTVEFIVSEDGTVSFLEVNTRVQVEHPVTEAVTGLDIIAEQFRIAAGHPLSFEGDPTSNGHAFEFRINAEDVAHGFVPCPGTITAFEPPLGPGIRVDTGVRAGFSIPGVYDSLLAKLIVWGPTREVALVRARRALREFRIEGVRTVLPFQRDIVEHPALIGDSLDIYTNWVDKEYTPTFGDSAEAIEEAYTERTTVTIEIDGRLHSVGLPAHLFTSAAAAPATASKGAAATGASESGRSGDEVVCPYTGTLVAWKVEDGEEVTEGQAVATVEAMKMESNVTAPRSGTIHLLTSPGDAVERGTALARIE